MRRVLHFGLKLTAHALNMACTVTHFQLSLLGACYVTIYDMLDEDEREDI